MEFEWDENKRHANILKHGIDFQSAIMVLLNEPHLLKVIQRNERRFLAVGELGNRVVTVVYTKRGSARRIISVRRARTNESESYRQTRRTHHKNPGWP